MQPTPSRPRVQYGLLTSVLTSAAMRLQLLLERDPDASDLAEARDAVQAARSSSEYALALCAAFDESLDGVPVARKAKEEASVSDPVGQVGTEDGALIGDDVDHSQAQALLASFLSGLGDDGGVVEEHIFEAEPRPIVVSVRVADVYDPIFNLCTPNARSGCLGKSVFAAEGRLRRARPWSASARTSAACFSAS